MVLIFCTPSSADIINRACSFTTGEPVQGFGGNGVCPFLVQYPFVTGIPSFSYSDISWRKYPGMAADELTLSFPTGCFAQLVKVLPEVAARYHTSGDPPEA